MADVFATTGPRRRAGPIDRRVGAEIRRAREGLGLSVEALAARLGDPAALVSDYESGRAPAGALALMGLSQALDVRIGDLLQGLADQPAPAAREPAA